MIHYIIYIWLYVRLKYLKELLDAQEQRNCVLNLNNTRRKKLLLLHLANGGNINEMNQYILAARIDEDPENTKEILKFAPLCDGVINELITHAANGSLEAKQILKHKSSQKK